MGFKINTDAPQQSEEPQIPKSVSLVDDLQIDSGLQPLTDHFQLQTSRNPGGRKSSEAIPFKLGIGQLWFDSTNRPHVLQSGKAWEELGSRFSIALNTVPFAVDADRNSRGSPVQPSSERRRELSGQDLKKLQSEAIELNGFPDDILLVIQNKEEQLRLGQDSRLKFSNTEIAIDKYGNAIAPLLDTDQHTGEPLFYGFSVMPRYIFSANHETFMQSLGIDLSAFGFGDYPDLMRLRSLPLIDSKKHDLYAFHSMLSKADSENLKDACDKMKSQIEAAERLFGLTPGNIIKRVVATTPSQYAAFVRVTNPDTIFFDEKILKDIQADKDGGVIPHELFHAFDLKYEFSLESSFAEMFSLLKATDAELFTALNEKGGHSLDTVFEFSATLTNSVSAPDWEPKMQAMPARVQGLYFHALARLKAALIAKKPDIVTAPIVSLIDERMASLRKILGSVPSFEDLVEKGPKGAPLETDYRFPIPIVGPIWERLRR